MVPSGPWPRRFPVSRREARRPWVTFGYIISPCVLLPVCPVSIVSPSSALHAAHAAPLVCSTATHTLPPPQPPRPPARLTFLCLLKDGEMHAGGKQCSCGCQLGGCEAVIKEPAVSMTAWWWGYLPICCFIQRLTTRRLRALRGMMDHRYKGDGPALRGRWCPSLILTSDSSSMQSRANWDK